LNHLSFDVTVFFVPRKHLTFFSLFSNSSSIRYLAIGAMHSLYRGRQTKKPLLSVIRHNSRVAAATAIYFIGFAGLFSITTLLFVRDHPFEEPEPPSRAEILDRYGFFD
jgi:hypothetical protein